MAETLGQRVYAASHLTGSFRLRSGQSSEEYFDKYLFEGQPMLLRDVAEAMVALLPECDALAGMEMGGIPLATVMSQLTGLPTAFVRKAAKTYGTEKAAEGGPVGWPSRGHHRRRGYHRRCTAQRLPGASTGRYDR